MSEQRKRRLGVKIFGWLIAITALFAPLVYYATREPELEVTAATVSRGAVEQTVAAIASGTVMPFQKSMVAAGGLGTVSKVHVAEGDRVAAGDLLVELDHAELDAQVSLTEANLKVGESRLEQVRIAARIYKDVSAAKLSQAAAQLDLAQTDYDRIKALAVKNAVSLSDFDKVTLALRVAQETKAAAEASQKENLVREEEIRSAEAAIEQLQAALRVAQAARDKALVRAPFAGVVAKRMLDVGEAVAVGLPVLQLVNTEDCYIEAPFDEANAAQIKLGQLVRISIDSYPNQEFSGEVTYLSPVVSINKDLSRTLDVKVRINEQPEKFLVGMSADITVIVDKKLDVLSVPSESLVRDEFVYVIENGRAVHRRVTLGIGNWERREVVSGLEEGATIITSVSLKELKPGVKVRIVDELQVM